MKKITTLLMFALAATGAWAYSIDVPTVRIENSLTGRLNIGVDCTDELWHGFQLEVSLPQGITMRNNAQGKPEAVLTDRIAGLFTASSNYQDDADVYAFGFLYGGQGMPAGTGPVAYMTLIADESVADGTYEGEIRNIIFASKEDQSVAFDDCKFTIVVDRKAYTLDENSTVAPTASTGEVNARVVRTVKAGEYTSFCLPFALTGEQAAAVLGSDAYVGDYTGWEATYASDEDENPAEISVSFDQVSLADGLQANRPYLVKTTKDISEFTVEGVTVTPSADPSVVTGSKRRGTQGSFIGNYAAAFTLPATTLYFDGGELRYSSGTTHLLGLRGYLELSATAQPYYDEAATTSGVRIVAKSSAVVGIRSAAAGDEASGNVYSIDGVLVSSHGLKGLTHGIYIVNGRKVVVK